MIDVRHFLQLGHTELEAYVSDVEDFISRLGRPGELEKSSLRSQPVGAYIRNMLAVGVLNRLMRASFLETERKVIVLPDCLKNYGDWTCCKENDGKVSTCIQCTPQCIVYETTERFADSRTTVVLEPEDMSRYFAELRDGFGAVGVVGVACALTMLSGFDRTLRHRLPTQGVFLNYSSCQHHWANPAYNTCYSLRRMAWVLYDREMPIPEESFGRGETYSLEKPPLGPDEFYRRLENLADIFEDEYLPALKENYPDADVFEICRIVQKSLVPDLITRESA